MLDILAFTALALALLPAFLTANNLAAFRAPRRCKSGPRRQVSLLIPARNEEANIGAAVSAALASTDVEVEVVVLDDDSTDRTAAIVARHMEGDDRVRLVSAPALPHGWNGKQHACHVLASQAHYPLMVFLDADVRLSPDALVRIAHLLDRRELDLASGFPREQTGSLPETLIVPLIHVLLLGYLPIWLARQSHDPAFAAGCGQLMAVRRDAYERVGGHAVIRTSRHDGLMLPRAFRRAGCTTDLFDATDLAHCRMYQGGREVWQGFSKNATEGMASPRALPVWTALLGGGHILPFLVLLTGLATGSWLAVWTSALAGALVYGTRTALAVRFRQSWLGAILHPIGIGMLLLLQWSALISAIRGRATVWRGRAYSS